MTDPRPAFDADLAAALRVLGARTDRRPETALILGSGLGSLADAVADPLVVPSSDLPGYPHSTVVGHQGRLVFGRLEEREVLFVQGRVHRYEGHPLDAVTFPVRLAHALGVRRLIVTNAAGGINPAFGPGTLMFITDHINFAFPGPMAGAGEAGVEGRLPGLADAYDAAWTDAAEAVALRLGIAVRRGVYLWASGPSYETKAEIRMFSRLGADAVGMSTVPEVAAARRLGLRVLGLSTITNPAAGLAAAPLDHEEVLAVGRQVRGELERLVRGIIRYT